MSVSIERRRFSASDYHRMAESGILRDADRVELLDGEVVTMTPIGRRHAACVDRLARLVLSAVGDDALVRIQGPIAVDDFTEPQPDLAVLRPRADEYEESLPTPADVLLLVEVSDSSAGYDRSVKLPLYARNGIVEVWLVDLEGERVEAYTDPSRAGYRRRQEWRAPETVRAGSCDLVVAVEAILRPASRERASG